MAGRGRLRAGPGAVRAQVTGVERLGSSDQLFLDIPSPAATPGTPASGPVAVRALARSYEYSLGDTLNVVFDPDRALFFDAQGARLESMSIATRPT